MFVRKSPAVCAVLLSFLFACPAAFAYTGQGQFSIPIGQPATDGVITGGEWDAAAWIDMDTVYTGTPTDLSQARWAAMWSPATNLVYVAITATDTEHIFSSDFVLWNEHDDVEIHIDAGNTDVTPYDSTQRYAQHYFIGPNGSGGAWSHILNQSADSAIPGGYAVTVNGNVITYEFALTPYTDLNLADPAGSPVRTLQPGDVIGLDMVIFTRQTSGTYGMLCENAATGKWNDAGKFLDHTLVGPRLAAYDESPGNGSTGIDPQPVLTWNSGMYAAGHDVYFGTDFDDVNDANNSDLIGIYRGRYALDANSYDTNDYAPAGLWPGRTYFWRIDEVNDACQPQPWKGPVWGFAVACGISVEGKLDINDLKAFTLQWLAEGGVTAPTTWCCGADMDLTGGVDFTDYSLFADQWALEGTGPDNTYYVRADAAGNNDGSDWTNAYTALPAALSRGATYYIADGSYSGYTFDDAVSGTSLIYIKKAIASDHGTSTGWSSSYGDGLATFGSITFTTSYWVIDGQTGGGPGSWETGFGIKLDASGSKIVTLNNSASNITLTHLDMEHNGRDTHNGNEDIVYALTASEDVTISYCYLHDVARCHLLTTSTNRFTIEYSKIARNGSGGDDIHREAWSAQVDDNVVVRYNIFEDISNTGILCLVNGNGNAENWQIYGNVFWRSPSDPSGVSAWVVVKYASPTFVSAVNWKVYNNAIVNLQGLGAGLSIGGGSGNVTKNNIWYNNNVNIIQFNNTSHDYNWFEDNYRTDSCSPPCDLDPTNAGNETNGIHGSADPFVNWPNGDFYLTSGTDARDNGTDLGTSYDEDAYGNTRGADGYWDIGAYEYVTGN